MRTNRYSLLALALMGMLACSTVAFAQDNKEEKGKGGKRGMPTVEQMMDRIDQAVTLTDAQKPKVKAVVEETHKQMEGMADVPQDQRREKMQSIRADQDKKLKDILTPEQYTKYEAMPRGGRGGKGGGEKKGESKKE
ncbi:MAG TPA: hypothetical protein VLT36_26015 [Candidatus Dormibacteraeota bacterium]|nr:hypothetical protein [Candidatus Dormibacteraeota bacterium]